MEAVDVRLGGKVHDRVDLVLIAASTISLSQMSPSTKWCAATSGQVFEIGPRTRVSQRVEVHNLHARSERNR